MLSISEIFRSIQGESTFAGLPFVFVRLAGCNLSCVYCDTKYARDEPGHHLEVDEIIEQVEQMGGDLVGVTGGEPLLQVETPKLLHSLVALGKTVLVETNGSIPLPAKRGYRVVMDLKCPSSGEVCSHHEDNPGSLTNNDEVKFVISDRADFDWAIEQTCKYRFIERGINVLVSPVHGLIAPAVLADWVLASSLPFRLQLQLHKLIWPDAERGR